MIHADQLISSRSRKTSTICPTIASRGISGNSGIT
jgi:hypothetical protein